MTEYDVAVLGAGPSGLTAAYCLGKAGARVVVLERAPHCGGLMRGVRHGDFIFDLGRKELYARFPEVHQLWTELLGDDYREYPHRVGLLYEGRILEKDSSYRGRLRGMSSSQVVRLGTSYLASQIRPGSRVARSVEDFYLLRYGRAYYDFFFHGYNLKFDGRSPAELSNGDGDQELPRFALFRRKGQPQAAEADPLFRGQPTWRHPAKGTQQIVDRLEEESRRRGVEFLLDTDVREIEWSAAGNHLIRFQQNAGQAELSARCVVSSVPLPLLMSRLQPQVPVNLRTPPAEETLFKKSTALVYLLADGEPSFAHNWLEVNDRRFKMGRVVNYATWNGQMIPKGKTGLCIEYFAIDGDPVMNLDKEGLLQLAVKEASANGLIDPSRIQDHLVLQLPKVNASTVIHDRKQAWLQEVSDYLEEIPRFFETSPPGHGPGHPCGYRGCSSLCIRRNDGPPQPGLIVTGVVSIVWTLTEETRRRYVRGMTRLSVWYVRVLLERGELRSEDLPTALCKRVDLYRLTDLWDGKNDSSDGLADVQWNRKAAEIATWLRETSIERVDRVRGTSIGVP